MKLEFLALLGLIKQLQRITTLAQKKEHKFKLTKALAFMLKTL
jgi:hypothetical protein